MSTTFDSLYRVASHNPETDALDWHFGDSPYPGLGDAVFAASDLDLVVIRWDHTQETVWEVQRQGRVVRRRGVANEWLRSAGPPLKEQVLNEAGEFMWSAYEPYTDVMADYLWT